MKNKKYHIRRGTIMMILGVVMLLGALSLLLYNHHKEHIVGERSENVLSELENLITVMEVPSSEQRGAEDDIFASLESDYNIDEKSETSKQSQTGNEDETEEHIETQEETLPDGVVDGDMLSVILDGHYYIGILEMPTLGITLPVQWGWSDALMDISPCRYNGTLQDNNLIIMAHNYSTHFGTIFDLKVDDAICFTDVLGNRISYVVCGVDVFGRSEIQKMYDGDWDLTLFTCVPNTYNRIAVRCRRVE